MLNVNDLMTIIENGLEHNFVSIIIICSIYRDDFPLSKFFIGPELTTLDDLNNAFRVLIWLSGHTDVINKLAVVFSHQNVCSSSHSLRY